MTNLINFLVIFMFVLGILALLVAAAIIIYEGVDVLKRWQPVGFTDIMKATFLFIIGLGIVVLVILFCVLLFSL